MALLRDSYRSRLFVEPYRLLRAVIDAPWATRLDHKITSHIIDRYFGKYGVARASLRYLEKVTGATRTNIIESVRRIIEQGVVSITRQGIGTRPTEYGLNFDFTTEIPSGPVDNTSASGIAVNTSPGPVGDTSSASSGIVDGTESYLLNGLTSPLKVSRNEDTPAVPTAPPVSGLEAHTAASAVDPARDKTGFERLWAAFPRKHHRSKAQAAYKALAPDAELYAKLVAAAAAWTAHYATTGTDKKWWKHLHTWLAEERWLEDLPEPYENPKEAALARAKERGARKVSKPQAEKTTGLSPKTPIGRHKVKIVSSELPDDQFNPEYRMKFCYRIEDGDHAGQEFTHTFKYLSENEDEKTEGQSLYADIRRATGILEPQDTSEFHDLSLWATVKPMGRIGYAPL